MDSAYIRLVNFLYNCAKSSGDYAIAQVCLSMIDQFPDILIEDIAYRSNTTPATITKFIHKLGYKSFKEFRYHIPQKEPQSQWQNLLKEEGTLNSRIDSFIALEQQKVALTMKFFEMQCTKQMIDQFKNAKRIGVIYPRYGYTCIHALREYVRSFHKTVDGILRDEDCTFLKQRCENCELLFLICLSGEWAKENRAVCDDLRKQGKYIVLIHEHGDDVDFVDERAQIQMFGDNILDSAMQISYFFALLCLHLAEDFPKVEKSE